MDYVIPAQPSIEKPLVSSMEQYKQLYKESLSPLFWERQAKELLLWHAPFTTVYKGNFEQGSNEWFLDGTLNVCENCVDRHDPSKVAIIYEADEVGQHLSITYKTLLENIIRICNFFIAKGLKKGDCVCIYMPMIPEAAYCMLACARMGLVHSVVFAGFSSASLRDRILDANAKLVITVNEGRRAGKAVPLKATVDMALEGVDCVHSVLVFNRSPNAEISMKEGRDLYWHEQPMNDNFVPPVHMSSEDTLFYLYTSGSTGKPKGIAHSTAGYLLYSALTFKYIFDFHPGDIFGCMADVGWITGHSYVIYGPLCMGATTLMFESVPTYPTPSRYWQIVQEHKLTHLYSAPTVIRVLQKMGEKHLEGFDLSSLRILGTVGEPINPDAWMWFFENVGKRKCSLVDTYWQTETGGIILTTLPHAMPMKPGSAGLPFFGISVGLVDSQSGTEITGNDVEGVLVVKKEWPSIARTIFGDHERYISTYFKTYKGYYFTGDGAHRDKDGYYWIRGRVDDVINVSGHRLSTAEIEGALCRHPHVAETAALGRPDPITGQHIIVFCVLKPMFCTSEQVKKELQDLVRSSIGPIAHVKEIVFPSDLPKTRSGKIMRRLLRKIVESEEVSLHSMGDLSTLNNPQ